MSWAEPIDVVGIDIPIGHVPGGSRTADVEARRFVSALVPKILEAAELAAVDARVHEVHPEVSFCALAGEHLRRSKKSWNGLAHRRRLLADAGIMLPDVIEDIGDTVADDVVDAAVVAWSARRIATETARSLPAEPQVHGGRAVAIWY